MTGIDVWFDIDTADFDAMVERMRQRVATPGLRAFQRTMTQPYLADRIEKRFANEGDDVVGSWPELRPTTGRIRGAQGYGAFHPINVRTGKLMKHVMTYSMNGSTLRMPRGTGGRILKSKLKLAQQGGYPEAWEGKRVFGPSAPAPPRPVIGLNDRDTKMVTSMLLQWVKS